MIYLDGLRSHKNFASGENRGVWNTQMRHLMSFNVHICVKRHHIHNSAFFIYFIFLLRLLQQVLFRIRDILQIKSSLVPISNDPIDLALTLKGKIKQTTH